MEDWEENGGMEQNGMFERLWVSVTLRVLSALSGVEGLHSRGSFGVLPSVAHRCVSSLGPVFFIESGFPSVI